MKKVLSVLLATLMLFSALGVSASASVYNNYYDSGLVDRNSQVVIAFDLNGGSLKTGAYVYDTSISNFVWKDGADITGKYIMLPKSGDTQRVGQFVRLPAITPPSGYQFDGWYCYFDSNKYASNADYKIPAGAAGEVIEFHASYIPADVEEDTFATVLGILIKVFGAIAGILLYNGDTEEGIALFDKILGALDF